MSPPPEINGPCWVVPMEAIRASVTLAAANDIAALVSRGVLFLPHVRVELGPRGFLALLAYQDPASLGVTQTAVLPLVWSPSENRMMA